MSDGLTDYERAVLRAYSRSAVAPWWKRFLWGRDVYHPALRTWRILTALLFPVAIVALFIPAPIGLATFAGVKLASIVVRWHSLRPR